MESARITSWSARLGRVPHVVALLLGLALAPLGCATYEELPLGDSFETGADGRHDVVASADGCIRSGADACDDAALRPDTSMSDAARNDAEPLDRANSDPTDERGASDASLEIADDRAAADASNTFDAGDVETDASDVGDVGDVKTDSADASDVEGGASDSRDIETDTADVSDARSADVSDARSADVSDTAPPPTFYRAINIGDSQATALTIDGQSWEAGLTAANVTYSAGTDAAGSGGLARVTNVPLIPATDANRTSMIQTFAWGRPIALTMSNVPTGRYLVYMYTWEDNGAQTFNVLLQGQVVLANYNSGANGHWEKLGPWPVDVGAGTIAITTTPTTGAAFANLCGIEVWRE